MGQASPSGSPPLSASAPSHTPLKKPLLWGAPACGVCPSLSFQPGSPLVCTVSQESQSSEGGRPWAASGLQLEPESLSCFPKAERSMSPEQQEFSQQKESGLEPVGALEGPLEYTLSLSLPQYTGPAVCTGVSLFLLSGAYLIQVSPCALLLLRPKGNRTALLRPDP